MYGTLNTYPGQLLTMLLLALVVFIPCDFFLVISVAAYYLCQTLLLSQGH